MVQFRTIKTIYMKPTKKNTGVNVTLDLTELKKIPDWVTQKKDGQEVRQFFINFARVNDEGDFEPLDKPSLYEIYDNDEDMPEGEERKKKEPEGDEPVPF